MQEVLFRYLTDQGDGTGDQSYIGNYSAATKTLFITPSTAIGSGSTIQIFRMLVRVEDSANMVADEYGNLGNALANGIQFKVLRGGVDIGTFEGINVKTNGEWGGICYDVDVKSWGSTPSDDFVAVRWTFAKNGAPIRLHPGDQLQVILSDDFTGLTAQTFLVGYIDEGWKA